MKHWLSPYNSFITPVIFCLLFSIITTSLSAQNPVIEDIVEELASRSGNEEADYTSYIEDLNFYLSNPLNLNEADEEKLEKLHFLNEFQIASLLNYIETRGGMKTIFELQLVDEFDMDVIQKLLPFVTVSEIKEKEKLKINNILKFGQHLSITESSFLLQNQKGYLLDTIVEESEQATRYSGDKFKYKARYKFHYKDRVFCGLSAEKDPGETFDFNKNRYGFDYYSAHFQINNIGIIKRLNVGDFQAKFGQGLILWTGFGMGKSSDVLTIRKKGQGLRYYTSTDENNFMRGVGTTVKFGKLEFTTFFSRKKIDAGILQSNDTVENEELRITSLPNTGYHRTQAELKNRKAIDETIIGSRIELAFNNFKVASNFVAYRFGAEIEESTAPYKLYNFAGNENFNTSVDYYWFYKKMSFFGETAIGKNGALAIQNGFVAAIVPQLSFSLIHRHYQKDYYAYYSSSFSENSKISNEEGLYYGIEFYPIRKLKLSAYVDFYKFPWLKFRVDAPSNGNEYFIQASYTLNRFVDMYFRWRSETKAINLTIEDQALRLVENQNKQQYRFHISYQISEQLNLGNRIEINYYHLKDTEEFGYMFYQDINYHPSQLPFSFNLRYAVFGTAFNTRTYAYENDILYNSSVPAYSGNGNRIYAMINYSILKSMDLRIRYSQFFYPGSKSIGSGLSEIEGNLKSELKFQIVLSL